MELDNPEIATTTTNGLKQIWLFPRLAQQVTIPQCDEGLDGQESRE